MIKCFNLNFNIVIFIICMMWVFIWLKSTSDFFLTTLRIPEAFRDVLDNWQIWFMRMSLAILFHSSSRVFSSYFTFHEDRFTRDRKNRSAQIFVSNAKSRRLCFQALSEQPRNHCATRPGVLEVRGFLKTKFQNNFVA